MPTRDEVAQMLWESNPENDGVTWAMVNDSLSGAIARHASEWTAGTFAMADRLMSHPTWQARSDAANG